MSLLHRRKFLQTAGSVAVLPQMISQAAAARRVSLVADRVPEGPGRWAVDHLQKTLDRVGVGVKVCSKLSEAEPENLCILAAGPGSTLARELLRSANLELPSTPESLAIVA